MYIYMCVCVNGPTFGNTQKSSKSQAVDHETTIHHHSLLGLSTSYLWASGLEYHPAMANAYGCLGCFRQEGFQTINPKLPLSANHLRFIKQKCGFTSHIPKGNQISPKLEDVKTSHLPSKKQCSGP